MYNLAFITQAKEMYMENCDAQQEEEDSKFERVKTIMFGAEPVPAQEIEDYEINAEPEPEPDDSRYDFGIS